MSKPTPNIPPERPNEAPSNKQDGTVEERVDTTLPDDHTVVDGVKDTPTTPATNVSLISGDSKPRQYKVNNPSFFMQRGYQVLLVLGLIAAFFLIMVYQTLFGRIEQPQQMVTIEPGQTIMDYYRSGSRFHYFRQVWPNYISNRKSMRHCMLGRISYLKTRLSLRRYKY